MFTLIYTISVVIVMLLLLQLTLDIWICLIWFKWRSSMINRKESGVLIGLKVDWFLRSKSHFNSNWNKLFKILLKLIKVKVTGITFMISKRGALSDAEIMHIQVKAYLQSESFRLKFFQKSNFFSEIAWVFDPCFSRRNFKWKYDESSHILTQLAHL